MSERTCDRCGQLTSADGYFCSRCGHQLAPAVNPQPPSGLTQTPGIAGTLRPPPLASLTALISQLLPVWLLVALFSVAAAQYYLTVRKDERTTTVLYALGLVAFLLVLVGQRHARPGAYGSIWLRLSRPTWKAAAGGLSAILVLAAALIVEAPGMNVPALVIWVAGLTLAVVSTALPTSLHLHKSLWAMVLWPRRVKGALWTAETALVSAMVVAGAAFRLYHLADYPNGVHGDETGHGLVGLSILEGSGPNPFGTAFLGDPALYFYLYPPFLALLGNTVTALRLLSGLTGALTVLAFFLFMRRLFSLRPAVLATILLAGSGVHIDYSRIALNVPQIPLLTCLGFLALWEAQRLRSYAWWLTAGIIGGVSVYFAFGGRLVPVGLATYVVYLLLAERSQWRYWLKGALVAGMGLAMALAPLAMYQSSRGQQFNEHISGRFIFNNWPAVTQQYHTTSAVQILWEQFRINLLGFVSGVDAGPFYSFSGSPLLTPLLGPLFFLGMALLLTRFTDRRYAMLAIWFWPVVVLGGVLSTDPPHSHRLLPAVLPALAAVALVLDWLVDLVQRQLSSPLLGRAVLAGCVALTLVAGYADTSNFFHTAAQGKPWETPTVQARYVAALGPGYRVYTIGVPSMYFSHSNTKYLAPDVEGYSINDPGLILPVTAPADKDLAFLVYPQNSHYLPWLKMLYPEGQAETVEATYGTAFTAWLVSKEHYRQWQGLRAQYGGQERVESDLSALGGAAASYPAEAKWAGWLWIGRDGRYVLRASGAQPELLVDDKAYGVEADLDLLTGWHWIELRDQLAGPDARSTLTWQAEGLSPSAIPSHFLDARPVVGYLRGQIRLADGTVRESRDRSLGFRDMVGTLGLRPPLNASWEGKLNLVEGGEYEFVLNSSEAATLSIDGKAVAANQPASPGFHTAKGSVGLDAGEHSLRVDFTWTQGSASLELLWTPPGGETSIIPPEAWALP